MSTFENAIPTVLRNEGGYVNNPNDFGGCTNFGISTRFLLSHPEIGITDAKLLTVEQAEAIYEQYWWEFYKYGNVVDQTIATKILDLSVNMGANAIHSIVQLILNRDFWFKLTVDGNLGPLSFAAINSVNTLTTQQTLITTMSDQVWAHYQAIIAAHPEDQQFAVGWKNRAYNINKAGSIPSS